MAKRLYRRPIRQPALFNRHHRGIPTPYTVTLPYNIRCMVHTLLRLQLLRTCSDAELLLLVLSGEVLVVLLKIFENVSNEK